MQRTRDQLLSGPRWSVDQDAYIRRRQSTDGAKDLLHRRCMTNDLCRWSNLLYYYRIRLFAVCDGPLHYRYGIIHIERLWQVLVSTTLETCNRTL